MDEYLRKPIILAFAGPNGSGKTTVARRLPVLGTYINADDLKKEYALTDLEAAQKAESLRYALLESGVDFSFETVLSTERNLLLLQKAKLRGYEVRCVYVLTCNENINVARVKARVAAGGHAVPVDKIRTRYHRALSLLPQLVEISDSILIYDNSIVPVLIFNKEYTFSEIYPNSLWPESALRNLLGV